MSQVRIPDAIAIAIGRSEALILFEVLSRMSPSASKVLDIEHPAERVVLLKPLSLLEKALPEPFAEDYLARFTVARASLVEEAGER